MEWLKHKEEWPWEMTIVDTGTIMLLGARSFRDEDTISLSTTRQDDDPWTPESLRPLQLPIPS